VQLHRDQEEFEKAGVELVVIGQGEPEDAAKFRHTQHVAELPMLTDRKRESYRAAGTKVATFSELLGPKVLGRGIRASVANRRHQGKVVGHAAQLGGVIIVKPGGEIAYSHLSSDASDYPENAEVLEAAREAAAG
jgi:peroxiredoxin